MAESWPEVAYIVEQDLLFLFFRFLYWEGKGFYITRHGLDTRRQAGRASELFDLIFGGCGVEIPNGFRNILFPIAKIRDRYKLL